MAVCNPPGASSLIGQTSTSCLQKFTIHFRRPAKLKQNNDAPYKGEYGFDWLRDEYIYPMEKVAFDEVDDPDNPRSINKYIELCINPINLRQEYLKDVEPPGKEFKPHGQDYYPAWLSIFACDVQGNNADAGSDMHKDGVYLDLQLNEIDKISTDETEIFFEPSDPCLKITPEKISISEFLKTKREEQIIYNKDEQPEINYYYYKLENAVKIICQGDTLKQHEMIKVFAKLGPTKIEVGRLMVYKNDNIGKANIFVVNVITEDFNTNKVIPQSHPSLKDLYNCQSFNQAMIRAEVSTIENFDLVALKNENEDVYSFLHDVHDPNYSDYFVKVSETPEKWIRGAINLMNRLCALYKKYGKHALEGKIDLKEKGNHNTYLFFTGLNSKLIKGVAKSKEDENNNIIEWGKEVMIFESGLTDDYTVVHEVGHSFSLPHTFDSDSPHIFYKGYTDNYMDYIFHRGVNQTFNQEVDVYNEYYPNKDYCKSKMHSFFKWQWDLMRKDLGIEKSIKDE